MSGHEETVNTWIKRGHALFMQDCRFLRPVSDFAELPPLKLPEIAFAGRSNVGKSSLINALTGRRSLARVSNTPGRTREILLFDLGDRLTIADLPGYGYARVSKAMASSWHRLIDAYLRGRPQLARVCLLLDARHPPHESDLMVMNLLDSAAASYVVVLTKLDKLNRTAREQAINDVRDLIARHPAAHPEFFATSAETGEGLSDLRAHLARVARPPEKRYKPPVHGKNS